MNYVAAETNICADILYWTTVLKFRYLDHQKNIAEKQDLK